MSRTLVTIFPFLLVFLASIHSARSKETHEVFTPLRRRILSLILKRRLPYRSTDLGKRLESSENLNSCFYLMQLNSNLYFNCDKHETDFTNTTCSVGSQIVSLFEMTKAYSKSLHVRTTSFRNL